MKFKLILTFILLLNFESSSKNVKAQKSSNCGLNLQSWKELRAILFKKFGGDDVSNDCEELLVRVVHSSVDEAVSFIKKLDQKLLDFPQLVRSTFNESLKNFEVVKDFIDKLDLTGLEGVLYDELVKSGFIDTVEHVMCGNWLKEKLIKINRMLEESPFIQAQKQHLIELKERLPEGIKNLLFSSFIIFTRGDSEQGSVMFHAIPSNEGRYFRIQDARDQKAIHYSEIDNNGVSKVGKGYSNFYYWQIIPINNARHFVIKNFANGFALSSDEYEHCVQWTRRWYWSDKCEKFEYYNKVYEGIDDSQKWRISSDESKADPSENTKI